MAGDWGTTERSRAVWRSDSDYIIVGE